MKTSLRKMVMIFSDKLYWIWWWNDLYWGCCSWNFKYINEWLKTETSSLKKIRTHFIIITFLHFKCQIQIHILWAFYEWISANIQNAKILWTNIRIYLGCHKDGKWISGYIQRKRLNKYVWMQIYLAQNIQQIYNCS